VGNLMTVRVWFLFFLRSLIVAVANVRTGCRFVASNAMRR
jgi:hypothetical protein